ncbi:ferrous iron transport protein B [Candidatus Bathyarchaeota archaeon RBG_13_52_12]|nr:MAG: ferrous iron transport protein B [Candidatus Bathyarchaeota archaeon RBG_13_52_12]
MRDGKKLTIALAGNANVGKSVIFNQLTGLHQHVGNWPGKTVKRAEGTLSFGGYTIDVVDLPGIYSLSTYSLEEKVSREYIAVEHPDAIINVVDASALERNLFFTVQLLEIEPHLLVALNQMDSAEKKGIRVDEAALSKLLGVPVVPTTATRNEGLQELMVEVIRIHEEGKPSSKPLGFGPEVEAIIDELVCDLGDVNVPYPRLWVAVKLLEGDEELETLVYGQKPTMEHKVVAARRRVEEIHGHDVVSVIASERYAQASRIASQASTHVELRSSAWKRLEEATDHPILGYAIMIAIIVGMFYSIFTFGDYMSKLLGSAFELLRASYYSALGSGPLQGFLWNGLVEGAIAGTSIALPYIVPFFLVLSLLEDSGYLARVAFLMDSLMHRIGLHGKGFIPMMLGFGCNVPACLGCSIMETERERLICAFVSSLVPCAARSIVIMGLVATYLGFGWAVTLYALDFMLIFILGRVAFKVLPGEPMGLIMEMPSYKIPTAKVTGQRTWFRLKDFIVEAFPVIIIGNLVIYVANLVGLLNLIQQAFSPVTVWWLGLPAATGIVLIFGVLRKELTLILLASLMGTTNFALILSPSQMFVFAFVVMIYIPCIATIAVLSKEFGARTAALISLTEIVLAVVLGGIVFRVFLITGIL